MKPRCLMLGAGKADSTFGDDFDYLRLDINPDRLPDVVGDATKLPFGEGEFEALYAGHLLEHLSPRTCGNVLQEWYRVLKPGGEMIVAVPNLALVAEYLLTDPEATVYICPGGPITALDMIYGLPQDHMQHAWGFTRESLARRAMEMEWEEGVVWEMRYANPLDRTELRLYGRKKGKADWKGWDPDVKATGDPYAVILGG